MPLLTEQALARTYDHPSVADPWEIVQQYREAMRLNPVKGSTAIAREVDAPRSRVRPWLEGSKPDAARAIGASAEHGWLAGEWTPTTKALTRLIAGVYACGSISKNVWRPTWTPDTDVVRQQIRIGLDTVGVDVRIEDTDRTVEIWATEHGSVLGRALAAAGAPVGDKTAETVRGLPDWLDDAPPSVRADFAELLVRERGTVFPDKATRRITGSRHPAYFRDVAALLEDVASETVTWSESGVTVSADAVRALGLAADSSSTTT